MESNKFASHLAEHLTPEWREHYIHYWEMTQMIIKASEEFKDIQDELEREEFLSNFNREFFRFAKVEFNKISSFYSEKLLEFTKEYNRLHDLLRPPLKGDKHTDNQKSYRSSSSSARSTKPTKPPMSSARSPRAEQRPSMSAPRSSSTPRMKNRKVNANKSAPPTSQGRKSMAIQLKKTIEEEFSEFYIQLILLQNFQILNNFGLLKILKKRDTRMRNDFGARWQKYIVEASPVFSDKHITKLIMDTEELATQELTGGDRRKAMKLLRVPPTGDQERPWSVLQSIMCFLGIALLLVTTIVSSIYHDSEDDNLRVAFRVYRSPLLLIQFIMLLGFNAYGWRQIGVNYILIFELKNSREFSDRFILELAGIYAFFWVINLILFILFDNSKMPFIATPLSLMGFMLIFFINPLHMFRWEARFWFMKKIGRLFCAPFYVVEFPEFWIGDQLNSIVSILVDVNFLLCFYIINGDWAEARVPSSCMETNFILRPIISILPAWLRFVQCLRRYKDSRERFPHLVNAGKYFSAIVVIIFYTLSSAYADRYERKFDNPFVHFWFISGCVSTTCLYIWDIKVDWGLFAKNAGANKCLRAEIKYAPGFYYFAMLENLLLRVAWIISFFLIVFKITNSDFVAAFLGPLEVFRRFVWNFIRLENEHLNNCGKFRIVRDIFILPVAHQDQKTILGLIEHKIELRRKTARLSSIMRARIIL